MAGTAQWHSIFLVAQCGTDTRIADADGVDYLCV